jgi:predicted acylesterase/phospholipase RssA
VTIGATPFRVADLGSMQVGTLVALTEADIEPDPLVGTSAGALNAPFFSTPGSAGVRTLAEAWSTLDDARSAGSA